MEQSTEQKVLTAIWQQGGEASAGTISKYAHISTDYARLLCKTFESKGYISLVRGCRVAKLEPKGKLKMDKLKPENSSGGIGSGRDQKGRFVLWY